MSHATNDNIVAIDNSRMMVEALKAKKVAVEYLELPRGDHGFNNHSGAEWQAWKDQSLVWLAALTKTIPDR
jgi:dipeptidyl aminopeptidase/acylaminoacyl peptidase